ncbi:MAG: RidA family protein [Saprospiraceae bacterium]|nr:RidA family protein [Saprospiraceae bacterium]
MKWALSILLMISLACSEKTRNPDDYAPNARLAELGFELPEFSTPAANFVKYRRVGNLIYLSGHGACAPRPDVATGKLGQDLTTEEGFEAAQQVGLCLLASLNHALEGDLSKVKQIVKVNGYVNSTPEFTEQHLVMNGFSNLMTSVFGERGKHARAAVGMASLPIDLSVEIEMIVEVE